MPELLTIGGFSAQATAAGTVMKHAIFTSVDITVYTARGQIQAKFVPGDDPSMQLGSLHAEVVCLANLGRAGSVDGGGLPANDNNDVWEMRIAFSVPDIPVRLHGSFLSQDNGRGRGVDYADENFAELLLGNPNCGIVSLFGLEQVAQGTVTVHD